MPRNSDRLKWKIRLLYFDSWHISSYLSGIARGRFLSASGDGGFMAIIMSPCVKKVTRGIEWNGQTAWYNKMQESVTKRMFHNCRTGTCFMSNRLRETSRWPPVDISQITLTVVKKLMMGQVTLSLIYALDERVAF